jgi:Double zinc ribbon
MQTAIFGIHNSGLNLVVSLIVFMLITIWVALIVWTYLDARRRIEDQVLVLCATAASLFPYIGTFVYTILRPPDFLEDARERDLEIKAAELRVRQLAEQSCPNCGFPVEKNYLRCPNCQRRLKDPCQNCGKPVDPRWALCPYCETALPGRARQQQRARAAPKPPRTRSPERSRAEQRPAEEDRAEARQPQKKAASKQPTAQSRERQPEPSGRSGPRRSKQVREDSGRTASKSEASSREQLTEERGSERG